MLTILQIDEIQLNVVATKKYRFGIAVDDTSYTYRTFLLRVGVEKPHDLCRFICIPECTSMFQIVYAQLDQRDFIFNMPAAELLIYRRHFIFRSGCQIQIRYSNKKKLYTILASNP
jgi:hypothetical protein